MIAVLKIYETEDKPLNPAMAPEAINACSNAAVAMIAVATERLDDADPEQDAVADDLLRDLGHLAERPVK